MSVRSPEQQLRDRRLRILRDLRNARTQVEHFEQRFLESCGFVNTSDIAATWLWRRTDDQRELYMDTATAIQVAELLIAFRELL